MIVFSCYVSFGQQVRDHSNANQSFTEAMEFSKYAPLAALVFLAMLVGSLYTTALEGLVDSLQRRHLAVVSPPGNRALRRVWLIAAPLSDSASARLTDTAGSFFRRECTEAGERLTHESAFVKQVVHDTLWMDGKLVGTPLAEQYRLFRSEGELEVSIGMLLAPTTASLTSGAGFNGWTILIATAAASLCAAKLIDYGFYYYRRANSFVAHHIADGSLLTPAMESLLQPQRD